MCVRVCVCASVRARARARVCVILLFMNRYIYECIIMPLIFSSLCKYLYVPQFKKKRVIICAVIKATRPNGKGSSIVAVLLPAQDFQF